MIKSVTKNYNIKLGTVAALQSFKPNNQKIQLYQPQMKSTEDIFLKRLLKNKAKDELYKFIKNEQEVNRNNLIYKTDDKNFLIFFLNFQTILSFGRDIRIGAITLKDAEEEQILLYKTIYKFHSSTRPKSQNIKYEKMSWRKTNAY